VIHTLLSRRVARLLGTLAVVAMLLGIQAAVAGPQAARAFDPSKAPEIQDRILSGFADYELTVLGSESQVNSPSPKSYFAKGDDGCSSKVQSNVKVNQNCLNVSDANLQGRGQAQNETSIAQDPLNPGHVVASYNDYRRGDGTCGVSYSLNSGRSWADATVPDGFSRGTAFGGVARQYWQAGGDTSVAWDTKGNAYLACQVFMRGQPASNNPDTSSAFYVYRSTGNFGASWNFAGRPVAQQFDNTNSVLLDKELLTVDNHVGSPYQDRVYVTWTLFAPDGTAYIFESHSSDYGETFGPPVLVSTDSSLCGNTYGLPTPNGRCNENQFSQPFTGSDGALYVTWANFNNPVAGNDNRNQMLIAKSTDGGATFSAPVKVGDYYDLPDCFTYQNADFGRACVPEKGSAQNSAFRATNYPSGAVNPINPSQVVVTFGSYINSHSKESNGCVPAGFAASGNNAFTGVKTAGACNNDILVSVSTNGGSSFTGTTTDPRSLTSVTQGSAQATTDQFWQWADFTSSGALAVSYYDRQYGDDEMTGSSDITVSGSLNMSSFANSRATSSSMPVPTQFPDGSGKGVFYGDYAGLTAPTGTALPLWSDTRNPDVFLCSGGGAPSLCEANEATGILANDQEIYTSSRTVPTP
jgi:hypothetical protein